MIRPISKVQKAKALFREGKYQEAIQEYQWLLQEEEYNPEYWNTLGDIYRSAGKKDSAIDSYHNAVDAYRRDALYNNAIAVCKKIHRIDPEDEQVYKGLGELYYEIGLQSEAIENFIEYANRKRKQGNFGEVVKVYKYLKKKIPENKLIDNELQELYLQQGIEKAKSLGPLQKEALPQEPIPSQPVEEKLSPALADDYLQQALTLLKGPDAVKDLKVKEAKKEEKVETPAPKKPTPPIEEKKRDTTTNLYNRKYFFKRVEEEVEKAEREKTYLSLLILDIDNLNKINIDFGDACGDTILRQLADILVNLVTDDEMLFRYDGDEFAILFPTLSKQQVEQKIKEINQNVENFDFEKGATFSLTHSSVTYPDDAIGAKILIDQALERLAIQRPADLTKKEYISIHSSELIGRDQELEKLEQLLKSEQDNIALITGKPFVGKTRFVSQFTENIKFKGVQVISVSCSREPSPPYEPFKQFVTRAQTTTFEEVARSLVTISNKSPLFFFIDNLQFADPSSIDLILYLAHNLPDGSQDIQGFNGLICCAFRDDAAEKLKDLLGIAPEIHLDNFTQENTKSMLELISGKGIQEESVKIVHKKSNGIPFLIEEFLKEIKTEEGFDFVILNEVKNLDTPESALKRRLAMLDSSISDTLSLAATIGETFNTEFLSIASKKNKGYLAGVIDKALEFELIKEEDKESYRFLYPEIRDQLEEKIENKEDFHKKIGELIEIYYSDKLEEVLWDIRYHFANAKDATRAVSYGVWAGDETSSLCAYKDALLYYKQALKQDSENLSIYESIAKTNILQADYASAEKYLTTLEEKAKDKEWKGKAFLNMGILYIKMGKQDRALDYFLKSAKIHEDMDDKESLLIDYKYMGDLYAEQGEYEKSFENLEQSLALSEQLHLDDKKNLIETLISIGDLSVKRGDLKKALKLWEDALVQLNEVKEPTASKSLASVLKNLGKTWVIQGEYDKGEEYLNKALTVQQGSGGVRTLKEEQEIADILINLAKVSRILYKLDQSSEYLEKAKELKSLGTPEFSSLNSQLLIESGILSCLKGDMKSGEESINKALNNARELKNKKGEEDALFHLGSLHLRLKNYESAQEELDQADKIATEISDKYGGIQISNTLVKLALFLSVEKTEVILSESEQTLSDMEAKSELWKVYYLSGKFNLLKGESEKAKQSYTKAIEIMESIKEARLGGDYLKDPEREKVYNEMKSVIGS